MEAANSAAAALAHAVGRNGAARCSTGSMGTRRARLGSCLAECRQPWWRRNFSLPAKLWLQLGCLVIALPGVDVALDWGILLHGCHRTATLSFATGDCGAGPGYLVWKSRPCRAPTSVEQRFSHSCWGRTQPLRGVSDAQRVSITLAQQIQMTGRSLTAAPH